MVGVAGFEPAATRSQAEYSTKLSYTPILEPPEGLEPPTRRLQGAYSTLLSYCGIYGGEYENRTRLSGVTSQYSNR